MLISDWRSDVCSSDLACDFIPDEFGRDIIRDGSAPVMPVAGIFFQAFTPQILSLCDILHFRRDDAALRIMHLADVHRSVEMRVGKACVSTCSSGWSRYQ